MYIIVNHLLDWLMHLFLHIHKLSLLIFFMVINNLFLVWIILFYDFFVTQSKLIMFTLLFYIATFDSLLLHTRFFPRFMCIYLYWIVELIDCIRQLLALNAILLTSSVNTMYFLLLNCCDFNINLLFFVNFSWFSLKLSTLGLFFSSCFILNSSWADFKQFQI